MTEHDEQVTLFEWAQLQVNTGAHPELAFMFAVPNGTYKSMAAAQKFKAEGLKKGVPDVWLPVARGHWHGLVIEMKAVQADGEPGRTSREQREWLEMLSINGYLTAVCIGADEAINLIEEYLGWGEYTGR